MRILWRIRYLCLSGLGHFPCQGSALRNVASRIFVGIDPVVVGWCELRWEQCFGAVQFWHRMVENSQIADGGVRLSLGTVK